MKKIYKKLTESQIKRGVVFSSCLSEYRTEQTDKDTIHEVFKEQTQQEQNETIARLKNDKFFNPSHYKFNIIRQ
jgi:hypothetical protein